jgi:hypothetical protein
MAAESLMTQQEQPQHQPPDTNNGDVSKAVVNGNKNDEETLKIVPEDVGKLLSKIYYNPSRVGSFGGVGLLREEVNKLLKRANKPLTTRRVVETWLSSQAPYVLHKRVRTRQFKRNKMKYEPDVGWLMQADVLFYSDIPHYGYKYMLLVQDTASRYLMYKFLKTKTCSEVLKKIKSIFEEHQVTPFNLLVDSGSEWFCSEFQQWADEAGCNVYSIGSGDSGKVPHLDRVTRYLQERMAIAFTHHETTNWVKLMPQLIQSQNRTFNRSIGMTPKEAWDKRIDITPKTAATGKESKEKIKYSIGQWVSILGPDYKSFSHKYRGQWTLSKFKIVNIKRDRGDRVVYYLVDELGDDIKNGFYAEEITPARYKPFERVEKVLKRKRIDGVPYSYVRYKYRDKRYDAWIKDSDLTDIQKVVIKRRKKRK